MDLIPDLPNDIARECLIRVSYKDFAAIASICKAWRVEIELPEFSRHRKATFHTQKLLVMAQARIDPNRKPGVMKRFTPVYRVTVLELDSGKWCELPPVPGFPNGLPMFCQVAAVGLDLVVMGGLDPLTWDVSSSVHVFNFASAKWRLGHDIPGVRRAFFGCASDLDRTVYVSGGHDGDKNALRSAMAYDVTEDKWVILPDMARERDECKAIFHRGKFHVVGGYCTEMQGQFRRSAEAFDVATWQWDEVQENLLPTATCPRTCVGGDADKDLFMCCGDDVLALKNTRWQVVAKLPADVCNTAYVTNWQGKLLVIGSAKFCETYMAYMLDLNKFKWTKMGTPERYSGHVQSGCYLEI